LLPQREPLKPRSRNHGCSRSRRGSAIKFAKRANHLPVDSVLLNSTLIDKEKYPAIMLAQSPQRDVHFRNIRGRRDDFMEVFPDEGSVNFAGVEDSYLQSFAFAFGYIRGLIQAERHAV
jgi:hypothetical protein